MSKKLAQDISAEELKTTNEVYEAAASEDAAPKKSKVKKHQKYTVDELLQHSDEIVYEDEFHRKVKIKVKVKESKLRKREARMGYVFVAPWILGALVFLAIPMFLSFYMSFSNVIINGLDIRWIGMDNFEFIFDQEKYLVTDFLGFVIDTVISVPLIVVFALIMAMLLNMKIRCRGLFRAIFFLPVIVVSGPVMERITGETSRVSTVDLEFVQLWLMDMLPAYLANPIFDVFSNIIMILWYSGVQILIFLAAIQKIDSSLYEAAKIDGGSGWECFWKITLPTIKPMILLNAIYTLIFVSQTDNYFINVIERYTTTDAKYGRASAMAWMFSLLILLFVGIIMLLFKPKADPYVKQMKKTKALEKKTRKQLLKTHKRALANQKKFEKHVAKQEVLRAKGKLDEGGRGDE